MSQRSGCIALGLNMPPGGTRAAFPDLLMYHSLSRRINECARGAMQFSSGLPHPTVSTLLFATSIQYGTTY